MIKGLHHIALRCINEDNYKETLSFYENIIGMKVKYSWGKGIYAATMLELNGSIIEIFASGKAAENTGTINHFCFETDNPKAEEKKLLEAGYPVLIPTTNIKLTLTEPEKSDLFLTYSYCMGPVGEVIEFYKEYKE
ncbi:MAG: VOC family protein [Treponema sp.]|nr:VOC family protein [Treponema sp.]